MTFKGPQTVIANGDMSGNLISLVTVIDQLVMASYSIVWTGTSPIGAIVVEVSNDYKENAAGGPSIAGTWNPLPLSAPTPVTDNSGNGFIDIDAQAGYALRIRYSRTSGTGSMTVIVMGK